jgi:two-component system, OmpR family, sensor histidine kinase KdpD
MRLSQNTSWHPAQRYVAALLLCGLCALISLPLLTWLDLANIAMLFLLAVALTAAWMGQGPAMFSAFLSVALFDFLFVEPRFSFAVHDGQYVVTFIVMLLVALLISHLSNLLQQQLADSLQREQWTRILYECARRFAGAMTREQIDETLQSCLTETLGAKRIALYQPDPSEQLDYAVPGDRDLPSTTEQMLIQLCYTSGQKQESEEYSTQGMRSVYLALRGATRMRGVLAIDLPRELAARSSTNTLFLEALASLLSTALERLHFVAVAQAAELGMQSERLRNTILASISHDVRTPLTVICGLADTLHITQSGLTAHGRELVESLRMHAYRLHRMVENLLDMARLQSGKVQLRLEWQPIEEVIGSSIHMLGSVLSKHTVQVRVPADIPLLRFDSVLMERVFANLFENAAKYSPPHSVITVEVAEQESTVEVCICNTGSLFPTGVNEALLDIFARGRDVPAAPGFGVGLSICRSIIEEHGGWIELRNSEGIGACVVFSLPLGFPPAVALEDSLLGENT